MAGQQEVRGNGIGPRSASLIPLRALPDQSTTLSVDRFWAPSAGKKQLSSDFIRFTSPFHVPRPPVYLGRIRPCNDKMAFIFTMHSHRRDTSGPNTLPAIAEDGDIAFESTNGPRNAAYANGSGSMPVRAPWTRTPNASPLSYISMGSDASGSEPDQEKERQLAMLRNNAHVAKRGGWRRLALITVVMILCLVGLIVGLVFGLKSRDSSSSGASNSTAPSTTAFPAGSWAIDTYLSQVTTNCTSNPNTWRCFPYITHAQDPSMSANFTWVISASPSSSAANSPLTYTLSPTDNPFSISFSPTPLVLKDANQATEYYSLVIAGMNKPVIPLLDITSSNIATTCYYNQSSIEARLYTKMARTFPPGVPSNDVSTSSGQFKLWPYAATIQQTASGGQDVPNCYDMNGKRVGDFNTQVGGQCTCSYMNYGT